MDDDASIQHLAVGRFREYLLLLARMQLGAQGQGKLEASDIVQQTLLEAHQKREQFRGKTEAEMAAWLRQMLAFSLADAIRALGRAKRDQYRERSLEAAVDRSSACLQAWIAAEEPSPSRGVQREEQVLELANSLAKLGEAQREALVLRHCQGLSLDEISHRMGRSPSAIAGLLKRGLKELREHLRERG